MKHLSNEALVDLAEGGTTGLEHLGACPVCRERVQSMRHLMRALQDDRVPEPSPLFWERLSDRISRAAAGEATSGAGWLWTLGYRLWAVPRGSGRKPKAYSLKSIPRWSWASAAVAALIVAVLIMRPLRSPDTAADRPGAASSSPAGQGSVAAADDVSWVVAGTDESWQIVEGAAAELDVEAAADAGIFLREGSLDRELLMLSDRERRELARAIRAELDRS